MLNPLVTTLVEYLQWPIYLAFGYVLWMLYGVYRTSEARLTAPSRKGSITIDREDRRFLETAFPDLARTVGVADLRRYASSLSSP
jgi:hypothetical protein